jgi:hypothetical protein
MDSGGPLQGAFRAMYRRLEATEMPGDPHLSISQVFMLPLMLRHLYAWRISTNQSFSA